MKFQFESHQSHQDAAVNAIVDVFDGQPIKDGRFTIVGQQLVWVNLLDIGISNKIDIDDEDILANVHRIQDRNGIARSKSLKDDIYTGINNFTIEMETGTGKTYAYTKTALELSQRYGFKKFIIVVPGVAIREWVYTSLKDTQNHFEQVYGRSFHYFIYDSSNPGDIKEFASSAITQIMIINIDAFRKSFTEDTTKANKANIIHRDDIEGFQGQRPIDILAQTNPIVIIDEPQSVDNTLKATDAIHSLNPSCILRYSATHHKKLNLVYRLWAFEAYQQKLVKHIEVLEPQSSTDSNKPYMKLVNVTSNGWFKADLELDIMDSKWKVSRKIIKVDGNRKKNIYDISGGREMYDGYIIQNIDCNPGQESITFYDSLHGSKLKLGETRWASNDNDMKRAQIRGTIMCHLDKEIYLLNKGIKVISLFFIDRVDKYRVYNDDGTTSLGEYGQMFEEEYNKIIKHPDYNHLFTNEIRKELLQVPVEKIHNGYFAMDKKAVSPFEEVKSWSNTDSESSTYNLIMKDKAKLLGFDTPLRFIFSHSALKEWRDNPNVFQVCTLVETVDTFSKRQKIWRGLRLPVNQQWERVRDEGLNILTVIANESYQLFADTLQKEIEKETGIKFGILEIHSFVWLVFHNPTTGENKELWYVWSEKIYNHLLNEKYIDNKWKVQDSLKEAINNNTLELPEEFKSICPLVINTIKLATNKLEISNKKTDPVQIKLRSKVLQLSQEFKALRDKIKYRTRYNITFIEKDLIDTCIQKILKMEAIPVGKIFLKVSKIGIEHKWVTASDPRILAVLESWWYRDQLPDIVRYLEEHTGLKRSSIVKILTESKRVTVDFIVNPQQFMEKVSEIINEAKIEIIMQDGGVTYIPLGETEIYSQEKFANQEIINAFTSNTVPVDNSLYTHILYDSDVEKRFAEQLNADTNQIKFFLKLPDWFKIDTPLGENYNPDRAILLEKNWTDKLYFVIETKSTDVERERRGNENYKIRCWEKHFEAIGTGVKYFDVDTYDKFLTKI